MRKRIEVLHGVNLNMLGSRPADHYGGFTLSELEYAIESYARDLGMEVTFFQTNSEREFVERLHRARDAVDGLVLNPGAWTHYSRAIRDALEIAALPAVEVHISDVSQREEWRRISVIAELCIATVMGRGQEGYRDALTVLNERLASDDGQDEDA